MIFLLCLVDSSFHYGSLCRLNLIFSFSVLGFALIRSCIVCKYLPFSFGSTTRFCVAESPILKLQFYGPDLFYLQDREFSFSFVTLEDR